MNLRTITSLALLALSLAVVRDVAPAAQDLRDVLYLRNGSIIKGTIVEVIPDSVVRIRTADGSLFVFTMAEVEKAVKEEITATPVYPQTMEKVGHPARTVIAPLVGYGTEDWFNTGLGIRIGSTLASGTYIGGVFVYHFGKTQSVSLSTGFFSVNLDITIKSLYTGVEVGHDIAASERFFIRPYSGFGYFSLIASASSGGSSASDSEGRFFISPGLMFHGLASEHFMLGLDGRYVIITGEGGSDASAFGIFGTFGFVL